MSATLSLCVKPTFWQLTSIFLRAGLSTASNDAVAFDCAVLCALNPMPQPAPMSVRLVLVKVIELSSVRNGNVAAPRLELPVNVTLSKMMSCTEFRLKKVVRSNFPMLVKLRLPPMVLRESALTTTLLDGSLRLSEKDTLPVMFITSERSRLVGKPAPGVSTHTTVRSPSRVVHPSMSSMLLRYARLKEPSILQVVSPASVICVSSCSALRSQCY